MVITTGRHRKVGRPKGIHTKWRTKKKHKSHNYSAQYNGMEQYIQTPGITRHEKLTKRQAYAKARRTRGEVIYRGKVVKRFRKWPIRW